MVSVLRGDIAHVSGHGLGGPPGVRLQVERDAQARASRGVQHVGYRAVRALPLGVVRARLVGPAPPAQRHEGDARAGHLIHLRLKRGHVAGGVRPPRRVIGRVELVWRDEARSDGELLVHLRRPVRQYRVVPVRPLPVHVRGAVPQVEERNHLAV